MRQQDFGEVKHHGGISQEWPIHYEDLESYYTQAGHLYHVHGTRGEDPTEPKASVPYKYSALTHEPRIQELHNDWQKCGYKPFHLPVGVIWRSSSQSSAIRPTLSSRCMGGESRKNNGEMDTHNLTGVGPDY